MFDHVAAATAAEPATGTATVDSRAAPKMRNRDGIRDMALPEAPGLSPAKPAGILLTPGTTRRNKTVTFGSQVIDNEDKKPSRSGLPNSCPGKFPSPWTPKTDLGGLVSTSQKRTKLTETLHQVRDSSKKQARSDKAAVKSKDDLDITLDFMEPRSQSGKYWKNEYESYAEQTKREVKQLLKKQKLAKMYAKDKETEVLDLRDQLDQEKRKVGLLEAQFKDLEAEMMQFRDRMTRERGGAKPSPDLKKAQDEAAKLRLENWKLREDLGRAQANAAKPQQSPKRNPAFQTEPDIWADVIASSPFIADATEKSPGRTPFHAATIRRNDSPLRDRDLNTLATAQPQSPSKQPRRAVDLTPKRKPTKEATPRSSRDSNILPEDSIDLSLALPQPSPEALHHSPPRSTRRTPRSANQRSAAEKSIDDLIDRYSPAKSLVMSSPPPKFDRMSLPIGMPAGTSDFTSTRPQKQVWKKPSLKESFAKVASPVTQKTALPTDDTVGAAQGDSAKDTGPVDDMSQKRTLSEERKIAAQERIAARRANKGKA